MRGQRQPLTALGWQSGSQAWLWDLLFPGGWHVSRGTLCPGLPPCDDEGHGVRSPCFLPLGLTPLGGTWGR